MNTYYYAVYNEELNTNTIEKCVTNSLESCKENIMNKYINLLEIDEDFENFEDFVDYAYERFYIFIGKIYESSEIM